MFLKSRFHSKGALLLILAVALFVGAYFALVRHNTTGSLPPSRIYCILHLKEIELVVQMWASEQGLVSTNHYSLTNSEILAFFRNSRLPVCPLGGTYSSGATVAERPSCSIAGTHAHPERSVLLMLPVGAGSPPSAEIR